jgi:hypothetical protein
MLYCLVISCCINIHVYVQLQNNMLSRRFSFEEHPKLWPFVWVLAIYAMNSVCTHHD